MRIERHPRLNVWVREDGCVYLPQSGKHPAHWTYGCKDNRGYLVATINGKRHYVHRLIAEVFIPNPENKVQVDHKNRAKNDNRIENLRWATSIENQRNTSKNDRVDSRCGTHRYEDEKQFYKEKDARRRKTRRNVRFSDGKTRYIPTSEAILLLAIPVNQRIYKG